MRGLVPPCKARALPARYRPLTLSLRMYKATGFLRSCSPLRGMPSAAWRQGVAYRTGGVGVPQLAAAPGPALTLVLQAFLVLLGVFGGWLRLRLPFLPGEGMVDGAAPALRWGQWGDCLRLSRGRAQCCREGEVGWSGMGWNRMGQGGTR